MVEYRSNESFVQIVYAKVKSNGKTELVPMKLYVDRSCEQLNRETFTPPAKDRSKRLLANRYELQQVLGQGGFGKTYLTLDLHRFNEPCVVKEFLPQHEGEYESQKSSEKLEFFTRSIAPKSLNFSLSLQKISNYFSSKSISKVELMLLYYANANNMVIVFQS
jgi:serine/threonine protein kinase